MDYIKDFDKWNKKKQIIDQKEISDHDFKDIISKIKSLLS